ncbi:hypothetical protein RFI_03781 [Reticulomyxa filosa]|uniref:Uncharacterized protein n=1 Tax=Reticulomyxa filosa TaxID=46433 RepID=X6P563_RETFI|nr:hypothetical protein RFI_03781 [Reticulomyxa filosa]|eukprot:ETO33326.1 hypothetical protein RFI_03781 [Reticulomyxa filosa]
MTFLHFTTRYWIRIATGGVSLLFNPKDYSYCSKKKTQPFEQSEKQHEELLRRLEWWELNNHLNEVREKTYEKDIERYEQEKKSLLEYKQTLTQDIENLEKELQHAKKLRNNEIECDTFYGKIRDFADRNQMTVKLEEMNKNLKKSEEQNLLYQQTIEQKEKQCLRALAAVTELQRETNGISFLQPNSNAP